MENEDPPDASPDDEAPGGTSIDRGPEGGEREERDDDEPSLRLYEFPKRKRGSGRQRAPTSQERENKQRRERRRRAFSANVYAGLRAHGQYKLPKVTDC